MMNLFIICTFIFKNIYSQFPSKYIFDFQDNLYENFIVTVCISKLTNCFPFKLSLSVKQVMVLDGENYPGGYKSNESESFKKIDVSLGKPYNDDYIYGRYGKDTIYLNNTDIAIENFQFIIIEKGIKQNNINFFGVIGIGYVYEYIDKDSGLLDKILLNADFKPNCKNLSLMKTKMLIGTELKSILDISKNKVIKKCKIVQDSSYDGLFACKIQSSFIYDTDYRFVEYIFDEQKVKFSVEQKDFYVPLDMYNFVKDIILPKKGNTECFEEISKRGKHKIKCNFSTTNYAYKNFVHFNLLRRKIYLIR